MNDARFFSMVRGASAYEVAVRNGFEGTEAEWIASLNGATGKDGLSIYYCKENYSMGDRIGNTYEVDPKVINTRGRTLQNGDLIVMGNRVLYYVSSMIGTVNKDYCELTCVASLTGNVLTSPDGTVFKLVVANDGTISAVKVT